MFQISFQGWRMVACKVWESSGCVSARWAGHVLFDETMTSLVGKGWTGLIGGGRLCGRMGCSSIIIVLNLAAYFKFCVTARVSSAAGILISITPTWAPVLFYYKLEKEERQSRLTAEVPQDCVRVFEIVRSSTYLRMLLFVIRRVIPQIVHSSLSFSFYSYLLTRPTFQHYYGPLMALWWKLLQQAVVPYSPQQT